MAVLVTSLASLVASLRNGDKVREVHNLVNSMSARNVALEKEQSRSEGVASERDRERDQQL
jgi:hypothetical protein